LDKAQLNFVNRIEIDENQQKMGSNY